MIDISRENGRKYGKYNLPKEKPDNKGEKNPRWKGGYSLKEIPTYDRFHKYLIGDEHRRSTKDRNILEVRCKYCGKFYVPTERQCEARCASLRELNKGDNGFYCSDFCKKECPIFHKTEIAYLNSINGDISLNREVQPELRKMVFARDDYTCQRCETRGGSLHCHHFEGIEINPIESADLDNCITLCVPCHELAHSEIGCRKVDMRRKKCQ